MPQPPARLRTPGEAIEQRRAEMKGRVAALRERFLEPILGRAPRLLPTKADSAARYALYSAVIWFGIWILMAALVAAKLVMPKLLHQFAWMSYGRLRPAEQNILMWGVLFTGSVGAAFAIVPRICGAKLWSERIGAQLVMLLDTVVLAGTVLLVMGRTKGIDGLEWVWPVNIAMVLAMFGVLQVLMFTALARTRALETPAKMLLAAMHVIPITYAVTNLTVVFVHGLNQTLFSGFGMAGFLLGMSLVGAGATLFVLPRATGNPIWSEQMASVALWLLVITLPWVGLAQRVLGPLPSWEQTIGIAMTIAAILPGVYLFTLAMNTARGGQKSDPSALFMLGGSLIFLVALVLNMVGSLRHPAAIVGSTFWSEAVRSAFFGAFGLWLTGLTYHVIPAIRGRALRSVNGVRAHFWVASSGIGVAIVAAALAGFVQGYVTRALVAGHAVFAAPSGAGALVWASIRPFLILRLGGGALILIGIFMFLFNVQRTLAQGSDVTIEELAMEPVGSNA